MLCAPLIHLFALHFGQYHETVGTPGIGAVCDISASAPQALGPAELAAGLYRNSDRDTSVYAVLSSQPWSVTTFTRGQPASSSPITRSAMVSTSRSISRTSLIPIL